MEPEELLPDPPCISDGQFLSGELEPPVHSQGTVGPFALRVAIRTRSLEVRYPRSDVSSLRWVDCEVERGTTTWIVGPNGSGKGTLGLTIAGMIPGVVPGYRKGEVALYGRDPATLAPRNRIDITGILHQDPETQLCTLSVRSEIALILENRNVSNTAIEQQVEETIRRFGLSHLADRDLHTLSGGDKSIPYDGKQIKGVTSKEGA